MEEGSIPGTSFRCLSVCIRMLGRHTKPTVPVTYCARRNCPSCYVMFKLSVKGRRKLYSLVGDWSIVCVLLVSVQFFM
jgi:hypothetical protein